MTRLTPPIAPLRIWFAFSAMCLGMFMAILDIQIVTTSLPTIRRSLGIAPDAMSWIQTAYLTAEIVAIPLTGYLTRRLGMRRLFVGAVGLFTLASVGCAASRGFNSLIAWRILQGFFGGTLIPAVFSAVFLLFPQRSQGLATTIAGVAAVLAPTVGPIVGGWITQTWSWHWLFLINVVPGILAAVGTALTLRGADRQAAPESAFDVISLAALAGALAALEVGLKRAPGEGWDAGSVLALFGVFAAAASLFLLRTWRSAHPLVELRFARDRNFALGCMLSFVLGMGLFGSTYLMPFFLGLVRGYGALKTGEIMLVTGIAQLATAPVAVGLERRVDPRLLGAIGFALFAAGLLLSAHQSINTGAAEMALPQVLRGAAIMFCLLPPTRIALGHLPPRLVADGSGLFNLMRNLGGAIGLALIDTIIFSRSPVHARAIAAQLRSGNVQTAVAIGIPRDAFLDQLGQPIDDFTASIVRPLVEKAALVDAINDAWLMLGGLTALAILLLVLVKPGKPLAQQADGITPNPSEPPVISNLN
jgi:DHA2 family multidrug resistance protein